MKRVVSVGASVLGALLSSGAAYADGLTYLVHAPIEKIEHPALIVLLHGAGADERDMITMWRDVPGDFVVVSPRAPICSPGAGCRWYRKDGDRPRASDIKTSREIIELIVDNAQKRFDADPAKIFVGGFSQGGVMTYDIALRDPQKFRGAVVLSGSLFTQAAKETKGSIPPFFIAHGTADNRIGFGAAQAGRETLAKHGVSVTFHAYPGMGHETRSEELKDLHDWLQTREQAK